MTRAYTDSDRVRIAAENARKAQEFLVVQIRAARDAGLSLRMIGEAAGLSYEQIRRMTSS